MAQLIVSGLDDDIIRRLQKRAEPRPLGSCIAQRFAGIGLTETLPELRGEAARSAQFEA